MKAFRAYQPEQGLLMPPSLEDWLPEGHLARFLSEVTEQLDLGEIYGATRKMAEAKRLITRC